MEAGSLVVEDVVENPGIVDYKFAGGKQVVQDTVEVGHLGLSQIEMEGTH